MLRMCAAGVSSRLTITDKSIMNNSLVEFPANLDLQMLVHITEACESRVLAYCLTHCSDCVAWHPCRSYVLCLQHSLNTPDLYVNADLTIHDM